MSQKTIEFEAEKPNLEVYLSYSQASERRVRFAYQLEDACARNGIRLIFDADELVLGDSIGRFMDELSQARFVILALSEDYFRSPFCMREFVDVFEWEYMDQRVIPVIHERIDSTELQKILAKWHGDHAVLESLGCPDRNYAKLVSRINHGCETLVKPYLDQVNLAVDVQTPEFAELIKRLTKLAEREREHDLEEL
ncbi:MAG: toll/interleukin-1 receptor domain-containing protein, partial [Gammaproteobacteria bacterium]